MKPCALCGKDCTGAVEVKLRPELPWQPLCLPCLDQYVLERAPVTR